MQWIVLFTGIAILLLLAVPKKKFFSRSRPSAPANETLHDALVHAAQRASANGYTRLCFPLRLFRDLKRSLSVLRRISDAELLPASQRLCTHWRFLQQEAKQILRHCRVLPRLPRGENGMPRAAQFADILIRHSTAGINEASIASALKCWQAHSPMTVPELNALPTLVQAALLRELCQLAHSCVMDQQARKAAVKVHRLHQKQKIAAARKKARPFENDPAFGEALFQLEDSLEWLSERKIAVQEAYHQHALHALRTQNAITALQNLHQLHWRALLEEASQSHELLSQDPVYCQMDTESQAFYLEQVSRIARRYRKTERAVCTAAISLCRHASARNIETHVGYYLLDEGYKRLLEQLDAYRHKTRFFLWCSKKKNVFSRIAFFCLFILTIGFGFMQGYAIAMLVPLALIFCDACSQFFHFLSNRKTRLHLIPRISLDHLTPDLQTLVICPCVLSSIDTIKTAVKHLAALHEAANDAHLHFMLLGDFEDSLTASSLTDSEFIAETASAIQHLTETTGHPFFFFQRERSSIPGERTWHGRERRRGAVDSILRLLRGQAVQDRFAFTSCDPAALCGRYRYILLLDNSSMLSMDNALKLIGAMLHPLQKRQEFKGRMRGVSIVQPQFKPAPQLNKTSFARWGSHDLTLFAPSKNTFLGEGLIDPEPFGEQAILPEGRLWDSSLAEGILTGCLTAEDAYLWKSHPSTLKDAMHILHDQTRSLWQHLILLNPFSGSVPYQSMGFPFVKQLLGSLNGILRLLLMLYAAFTGRDGLLLSAFLIPEFAALLPFSAAALRSMLLRLSLLPSTVYTQIAAISRALFRMLLRRQQLLEGNLQTKSLNSILQPSMLYFTLHLSMAGVFAAIPVLFKQSWSGLLPAVFWAAFPFWLPYAEAERPVPKRVKKPLRIRLEKTKTKPVSRMALPLSVPPDAHLLTGGDTTVLIDAQGGGRIMHKSKAVTRFDEHCSVPSGLRIYLRDSKSGVFWMVTDPWLTTIVRFESSQAVFCAERKGISSELRLWINPLDGACIHQLMIQNLSNDECTLELCTYLEPASDCLSDSCPIESQDGYGVSYQKISQRLVTDAPIDAFTIQTDRSRFLGRGGSILSPQALAYDIPAVPDTIDGASDPCISLRAQFRLPARSSQTFCLITQPACEQTASIGEYLLPEILASCDSALTFSLATARCLKLTESMQLAISRMTGFMAYDRHSGVSQPLLLYQCRDTLNEPLLKVLLGACAFWQFCGFPAELVILIEESAISPLLLSNAESLISTCSSDGVHLLSKITQDEKQHLFHTARLTLSAENGALEQQLVNQTFNLRVRPRCQNRPPIRWKHRLPAMGELMFSSGFGGFAAETGNYTWTLPPGQTSPANWHNSLCSSHLCTLAGDGGLLSTSQGASVLIREEQFFIRDANNRLLWSPTRLPLGHYTAIRTTHAPGETTYESSGYGIYTRIHCFSDTHDAMGVRIIHLQNTSQNARTLTFFHMCRFGPNARLTIQQNNHFIWSHLSGSCGGLCALEPAPASLHTMPYVLFQGIWGRMPFALSSLETLPAEDGDTAVLAFTISLKPGESRTLHTAVGFAAAKEALQQTFDHIRTEGASTHLHAMQQHWENRLSILQFDLPDRALNLLLGRWLPYQVMTFCQRQQTSTETLEPAMLHRLLSSLPALLLLQPDTVRKHLLKCADHPICRQSASCALALVYDLAAYADASGDTDILQEKTALTDEPLLNRCITLLDYLPTGAHGLPLEEDNESVPLGMLLCEVLRRIAPYCADDQSRLFERRSALMTAIERYAWDGGWYLSGWENDGSAIGSTQNPKQTLALIPQALAVLCGFSRERCETALENAWTFLRNQNESHPSADVFLMIAALHQLGQEKRAWHLVQSFLALVKHPETFGEWRGSCSAYFLAVVLEQLFGLRKRGNELTFKPVVPDDWESIRITWRFGTSTYHLRASRTCLQPAADGHPLPNGLLLLADDGRIHEVFFPLRS